MYRQKLCLGLSHSFGESPETQLKMLARIGFEGFFNGWDDNEQSSAENKALAALAGELGMEFQSIHAPFGRAAQMWMREYSDAAVDELIKCARHCAEVNVPIMVAHAFIGFGEHSPSEVGIESYGKVVRECERLGIRLALENTEGDEYLSMLMDAFKPESSVGFCFDSGHELCYNYGRDQLALYGDRLIATHLNDNLGIRSYEGEIYWHDDLHLLPFDGIADWQGIAERLDAVGFTGPLTFELTRDSKPNRHENAVYKKCSLEEYFTEVYKRACKVASLRKQKQA